MLRALVCAPLFAAAPALAQQVGDEIDLPSGARVSVVAAGDPLAATPGPTDRVVAHLVVRAGAGAATLDTRALGHPLGLHLDGFLEGERLPPGLGEALERMGPGDRWRVALPAAEAGEPAREVDVEVIAVDPGPPLPAFRPVDLRAARSLESGAAFELLAEGSGPPPTERNTVHLRYTLWTEDGEPIESSLATGQDLIAPRDRLLVPGLREVVALLAPGAVAAVHLPPSAGFGEAGYRGRAAGAATVWRVELLDVFRANPVPDFALTPPESMQHTTSGLGYEVLRAGAGLRARPGDRVLVRYAGWLPDGELFDESYTRELPYDLTRGGAVLREDQLLQGWVEGIPLMSTGGVWRFTVPPELGYGDREQGGIPAGSTLVFVVELVAVL